MKERGLIPRIVPYSDSSSVLKCLTASSGVQSYFIRLGKKARQTGHLQTGQFIVFSAKENHKGLSGIAESYLDPDMASTNLRPHQFGVWLFTIELLNKTLPESFNIPGLRETIDRYFVHLAHQHISEDALTPLLLLTQAMGLIDLTGLFLELNSPTSFNLKTLGYQINSRTNVNETELFDFHLYRFMEHFGIQKIDSLDLL